MPVIRPLISNMVERLNKNGIHIEFYEKICNEPSITDFDVLMAEAKKFGTDSFLGIGGGSILDITKLVATLIDSNQKIEDLFGINLINHKGKWFACMRLQPVRVAKYHPTQYYLMKKTL